MSKYNVGLKTLLLQGLSEPEFYGDFLAYKFRKIIGKNDFSYAFSYGVAIYSQLSIAKKRENGYLQSTVNSQKT